jgi:hypothetical protein
MRRELTASGTVILTAFALTAGAPAHAATLQVPAGHARVGLAIAAAAPGDTILVAAGTYSPSANGEVFPLTITKSNLVLLGAGSASTILDAEQTAAVIVHQAATGGRVAGLTLTGGWTSAGGGMRVLSGSVQIDHNLFLANAATFRGSGVFVGGAGTSPWIHHNVIWESYDTDVVATGDPHGIQLVEGSTALVEHNLVGRGDSNGLLYDTGAAPIIRHNIFFENGIEGLRGRGICAFGDSTAVVSHNLFHGNVLADLLVANAGNVTAAEANDFDGDDGIYGNLSGDPLFVDADGLDVHLLLGSPAIDAGDPTLPFDPDGTIADIGPFFFDQGSVAVPPIATGPGVFGLRPNSPNPFSSATVLRFDAPDPSAVRLEVVDIRGRVVRRLPTQGQRSVTWDGRNESSEPMPSGIYFVRLTSANAEDLSKIVLVR